MMLQTISLRIPHLRLKDITCILQVKRVYSFPTEKSSTNFLMTNRLPLGLQKERLITDQVQYEEATTQTLRLPDQLRPGDIRRYMVIADRARHCLFWEENLP